MWATECQGRRQAITKTTGGVRVGATFCLGTVSASPFLPALIRAPACLHSQLWAGTLGTPAPGTVLLTGRALLTIVVKTHK